MYRNEKINDHTYKILDSYNEAMYLLIGQKRALLIDAGMEKENLFEYVSSFTSHPIDLALSHGHIDHIGRSGDFENVYMNLFDQDVYLSHMNMNIGHFKSDGLCFKNIKDIKEMPSHFDLGDIIIDVLSLGGHTPGSMIFIDQKQRSIFTGDAIGSGCGCWMQLDECLHISIYQKNIQKVIKYLENINVDDHWLFYGGHDQQEYQSKVSDYNRLDMQLLKDMEQLCQKLLNHQVRFEKSDALMMSSQPYYVFFQKAEMIVTKEKIRMK
ncbi:MAG: MBL fold metallo-hydrolase [Faecalibacillus sp.]